tara:strand:+ start:3096 stop:4076 length:981 start_codon:yes stop_codon:yes gene_type:complete
VLIGDRLSWEDLDSDWLDFYAAIGVDTIHLETRQAFAQPGHPMNISEGRVSPEPLERARETIEAKGLTVTDIVYACPREIPLGLEEAEARIEAWCRMLEASGRAGIPVVTWVFKPMGNFRTEPATGRGGSKYSMFDYDRFLSERDPSTLYSPEVSEDEMWERMEGFLKAVIPAAESAGVTMALHPDDPPVPEALGGVWQICSTTDQFRRIFDTVQSDRHQMLFCQGCMTELLGDGVYDFIAEMSSQSKIAWVHFRNVRGRLPRFEEVFIDEGDIDMRRAMETYRDNGYEGPFAMDHTPHLPCGDSERAGKAFANGYIRRLIQEVYG